MSEIEFKYAHFVFYGLYVGVTAKKKKNDFTIGIRIEKYTQENNKILHFLKI